MVSQNLQKCPKWGPKRYLKYENVKKVKSNEKLIFTVLLRGWDIRIHENFHSKIIKKRDCSPNVILNCSNQRKNEKVMQKGLQWETQNPPQIAENQFWSRLSAPLHPMITQIMKKWCPKTQNAWKLVPQDLEKSTNLNANLLKPLDIHFHYWKKPYE